MDSTLTEARNFVSWRETCGVKQLYSYTFATANKPHDASLPYPNLPRKKIIILGVPLPSSLPQIAIDSAENMDERMSTKNTTTASNTTDRSYGTCDVNEATLPRINQNSSL